MAFYLGNPGGVAQLPHPRKGLDPTAVRASTTTATIGGGQAVSFAPGSGRRTYHLDWSGLTQDQYSIIEEFFVGARGPGPFALLDPGRRNKLTANQASATSANGDTTGFTVLSTAEAIATVTSPLYRGPSALRWSVPAAGGAGILRLDPPSGLPGVPCPAGQPWTFSAQLLGAGVDPALTVTAALRWMDAAGTSLAATIGAPVNLTNAAFAAVSVTAAQPPAGAYCLQAELRLDLGSISAQWNGFGDAPVRTGWASSRNLRQQAIGSPLAAALANYLWGGATADIIVDVPQLDMSASVRAWVAGTGVPRVSVLALSQLYKTLPFHTASATLVEAG